MLRRAFSFPELAAVIVVVALALVIASIGADRSRALARCGEDLSHFRQIFAGTTSYAADSADLFWHFSWTSSPTPSLYPDLRFPPDRIAAAKYQMVDIIRRRTGRTTFPSMSGSNLVVNVSYSQLVLLDYLDAPIPGRLFAAAGDARWNWANDPLGYDAGLYTPNLGIGGDNARHPYGGSFKPSFGFIESSPIGSRMEPYPFSTASVSISTAVTLAGRPLSEVAFPSQKVMVQDLVSRYFGRPCWYSDQASRMPVLMADGSASVRAWSEANPGASPNSPAGATPTQTYQPTAIEPPASIPAQNYPVSTLWTRLMLQGRDFGGPPIYP
jgi:hypothetical protein